MKLSFWSEEEVLFLQATHFSGDPDLQNVFWSTMTENNAVSLKLPTFWTSQPQVWFQQAEVQFAICNITTDHTKYCYIVAAFDQDTAGRLLNLLRDPPEEQKYETIKAHLTKTFGLTCRVQANRFLQMADLGDRRPSALMDELLSLLDGHQTCMLFK